MAVSMNETRQTRGERTREGIVVAATERFPHLYELKRVKSPLDMAHIAESFRPYLEGRDWISIERPAP